MRKSDKMKWPFKSEDMADNLIEWAGKIKTLGEVWGALSCHVDRYDGDTDALSRYGEMLGMIIAAYAGLIEDTVTEDGSSFVDHDKNAVAQLVGSREAYELLKNTKRPEDIMVIDQHIQGLSIFIHNSAMPAVGLKNDFEDLKKAIIAKQEKAPKSQVA